MSDIETRPTNGQTETLATSSTKRRGRPSRARGAPASSDDAEARWTVRGVPLNVRRIATEAAERQGQTVGDFLAAAIVAHARADGKQVSADGTPNIIGPQLVELVTGLQERLTKLEERDRAGWFGKLLGRRT